MNYFHNFCNRDFNEIDNVYKNVSCFLFQFVVRTVRGAHSFSLCDNIKVPHLAENTFISF